MTPSLRLAVAATDSESVPEWFEPPQPAVPPAFESLAFRLQSPGFDDLGNLPQRYGAAGDGVSPPLAWSEPPVAARELAIVLEQRDGVVRLDDPFSFAEARPGLTRWLGWGLAPVTGRLEENATLPVSGTNDLGTTGYAAPQPLAREIVGRAYRFTLLALDVTLELDGGATRDRFDAAIAGHVVAAGTLVARHKPERGLRARLRR